MKLDLVIRISIIFVIVMGGTVFYQNYFNEKEPVYTLKYDESLSYTYYKDYGNSEYLVDNWTLRYYHTNWTEPIIWYEYGPFSVVFETPKDDMILKLSGVQITPETPDFIFPLVIYPGDAYSVETEPIWTHNVTCSNLSEIKLDSSGVYTISLTGHVMKNGHRYSLRNGDKNFETVLVYIYFQLVDSNGDNTKFKVDNSLWDRK